MGILELFLIAVGLSMDALAIAVCTGLAMPRGRVKAALTVGLYFGVFQALMPLLGFALATRFSELIAAYDHWIAFVLLSLIGGNMVVGSFRKEESSPPQGSDFMLRPRRMLPLALATSIDALAVGVSFAFLRVSVLPAAVLIGLTTFALSLIGVLVGKRFGARFQSKAELLGGAALILIGLKILLEHLGVIRF